MSKYITTAICWSCWRARHPGRKPVVVTEPIDEEPCGFCGKLTKSGIFVRAAVPIAGKESE